MPSSEGSLVSEAQREQIISKKMQNVTEDDADSDSDVPPPPPPPSSEPISVSVAHEPSSSSSFIPEPQLYPALSKKKKTTNRRKSSTPRQARSTTAHAAATVKKTVQKKNAQQSQGVRRKHRFRPGTVALREIRKLQKGTENLVPKRAVVRLIKEIMQDFATDMRLTKEAGEAIQCIAETFVVELFEDSNLVSINSKRVTVMPRDVQTVLRIQRRNY